MRLLKLFRALCAVLIVNALFLSFSSEAAIEVTSAPGFEPAAARLRSLDPARIEAVSLFLGASDPPIHVTVTSTNSSLAAAAPNWAAGYALPSAGVVVLFPERNPTYPDDSLEETYLHEIAHVMIFHASGGGEIPRWFHEGVATVAGREWSLDDWRVFAVETLISGAPSRQTIDILFGKDAGSARQAYVMSARFVRDLTQKYGQTVVRDILAGVRKGEPFDRAFFNATLLTPDTAWQKFREGEMQSGRLIPILTSSFVLWIVITIIGIAAIFRRRKRDVLQTTLWELEEELEETRTSPDAAEPNESDPRVN